MEIFRLVRWLAFVVLFVSSCSQGQESKFEYIPRVVVKLRDVQDRPIPVGSEKERAAAEKEKAKADIVRYKEIEFKTAEYLGKERWDKLKKQFPQISVERLSTSVTAEELE